MSFSASVAVCWAARPHRRGRWTGFGCRRRQYSIF